MSDVEDRIAEQLAVVAALEQLRSRERDPDEKAKLRKDEQHAKNVLAWFQKLREDMRTGQR